MDGSKYSKMAEDAVVNGTYVLEQGFLFYFWLDYGKWHRSKEKRGGKISFASHMMNKKWTLEEEFTNHMMMFQQVPVSSYYFCKVHFDVQGWIDSH